MFRSDIAQATGLAQSVAVNTAAEAVPVREQNLDAGNIKVHEQGTANVAVQGTVDANVTNSQLAVVPAAAAKTASRSETPAGMLTRPRQTGIRIFPRNRGGASPMSEARFWASIRPHNNFCAR